MPISPITLQRRHAELGRIRLGNKVASNGGRGRPNKLDRFRFTSVSERYIADLATLYGGQARPWDNGGIPSHEVITDAQSIPVIVVKGGLSQWMETWSGGGCVHRCDGQRNALTDQLCDPDDENHQAAKPTTRLSLMLPELEAIGVWRMESHGWNAAAEIPAVAELAQYVGELVPAHLNLVERRAVRDGKTSRFVVPVLDLQIGTARLREIVAEVSGGAAALEAAGPKELTGGGPVDDPYAVWFDRVAAADSIPDLQAIWQAMVGARLVGPDSAATQRRAEFFEAYKARGAVVKPAAPTPDADGAIDAEVVEDTPGQSAGDADAVWQKVLKVAGELGMSLPDVQDEYAAQNDGQTSADATAAQLTAFLQHLRQAVPA